MIAIGANVGSGYASTYAREIVTRCFVGIGASVALAIGGATVSSVQSEILAGLRINALQICDMFFQGERGKYMGFYALALTNGVSTSFNLRYLNPLTTAQPHFGPIAGGYIALNLGWRWIFFVRSSTMSHSSGCILTSLRSMPSSLAAS